jgi:hypothetical protein
MTRVSGFGADGLSGIEATNDVIDAIPSTTSQGLLHRRLLRAQMLRVPARDTHDEGRRERARRPWREEQQQ